jgi:hypothetical protein
MQTHQMLACTAIFLLTTGSAMADQAKPASPAQPPAQTGATAPPKFVRPITGEAELGFLAPVTKRQGKEVVTIIKVKNLSTVGSIAGLKVDEYWYDKKGELVTGDSFRYRKPLLPGEVIEVTLRTPVSDRMDRNQYTFTHANGKIKTKKLTKL